MRRLSEHLRAEGLRGEAVALEHLRSDYARLLMALAA
jgi:hypothetical protein